MTMLAPLPQPMDSDDRLEQVVQYSDPFFDPMRGISNEAHWYPPETEIMAKLREGIDWIADGTLKRKHTEMYNAWIRHCLEIKRSLPPSIDSLDFSRYNERIRYEWMHSRIRETMFDDQWKNCFHSKEEATAHSNFMSHYKIGAIAVRLRNPDIGTRTVTESTTEKVRVVVEPDAVTSMYLIIAYLRIP
jgi:hypothetical protein